MASLAPSEATSFPDSRPLRLGFLAQTDAAPLIVAHAQGHFAAQGLRVELRREIGWASLRDKVVYGELDAAHAPAPLLWSLHLGLDCPRREVLTALVLSRNGSALTLSRALRDAGVTDGASLHHYSLTLPPGRRLTFGVGFHFASPHLYLRAWLRAGGFVPDQDVRIVVVPPSQLLRHLAAGTLDGWYADEPWNSRAVRAGTGWCPCWSAAQHPGQVDKVLMVTRRFAEENSDTHAALVQAVATAARWCDEPQNREPLAELLAAPRWLNLPADLLAPTLQGKFDRGAGPIEHVPDFHVFDRNGAGVPTVEAAVALQDSLGAAGLLSPFHTAQRDLPHRLFREDLHRAHPRLVGKHAVSGG